MSRWLCPGLSALVALCVCLWRIGTPSYWRDESVSVVVGHGGWSVMREFVDRIDAVHALYYTLMHAVTLLGTSETITRLPSALAVSAAAAGIAVLGTRLHSPLAGLYAGLVYGLLPITSRYGQEVRQYALVSAGVVLATYLLVRALSGTRAAYFRYAALMGLLGWLHLYALFVLPAHAVAVLLWSHEDGAGRRRHLLRWTAAASAAVLAVAPLVLVARGQEGTQVAWLKRPGGGAVHDFGLHMTGGGRVLLVVLVLLAVAGAIRLDRNAAAVIVPWAVVPFAVAWTISQAHPVYHPRYVLYCVCGLVLLIGAGLADVTERGARGRRVLGVTAAVTALACLAIAVFPSQRAIRGPRSRPDDLRSMAVVLRERARPGDAVLYVPAYRRAFATAYADAFTGLDTTTLHDRGGADMPTPRFREALGARSRIWVVEIPPPGQRYWTRVPVENLALLRADRRFAKTGPWRFGGVRLTLHARRLGQPVRDGAPVGLPLRDLHEAVSGRATRATITPW